LEERRVRLPATDLVGMALPPNVRALVRADDDYLIRRTDYACGKLMDGDYLRAYIWTAINVLSVSHLTHGDEGPRYAALFDFPPDSQRKPVPIQRLADLTRLPYETVRRHANKLVREGICIAVPKLGVLTPTATFRRDTHVAASRAMVAAMQKLIADLHRAGVDFAMIGRAERVWAKDLTEVARAFLRLDADYMIDVLQDVRGLHEDDPVAGVVFTAVLTENMRHPGVGDYGALETVMPDPLRRPVSTLGAATSLNIPYETVRRMLARMAKADKLKRMKDGYIVPAQVEAELLGADYLRRRLQRLSIFLKDLWSIGVPMPP
jgi:DNA-binding IclR family transcriptional regulator